MPPTPVQQLGVFFAQLAQPFQRSLALRPALALSPIRDTLIEGFSHFVTSMTAPIASGWSDCRVGLHPLESAAFARRTPEAVISTAPQVATLCERSRRVPRSSLPIVARRGLRQWFAQSTNPCPCLGILS